MTASMRLSAVEQSPYSRTIYTQLCFCYTNPEEYTRDSIIDKLDQGLRKLTTAIPWLAGQVIQQDGFFYVAPFQSVPTIVVKDLTLEASAPSIQGLKDFSFPFHMLEETLICPRNTLSDGPNEDESQPYPVLLLQVNIIHGGILLSILCCHSLVDIVGQVQVIRLLSKACNTKSLPADEIADCNIDREDLIPLLDDDEKERNIVSETTISTPPATLSTTPDETSGPPQLQWAYFKFSAAALATLKASVTSILPDSIAFVSTDDCICAVLWQRLAHIRLARLDPATPLKFLRQVDVRQYMEIPNTYPGNMVTTMTAHLTLAELASLDLSKIAPKLRALLDLEDIVHNFCGGATAALKVAKQSKTSEKVNVKKDRENSITMSSWSKASCADIDFGLGLGPPLAVRRPRFTPIEGLVYLLPKEQDGTILAALCLREEDMNALKADEEFMRWTGYIG